MLHIRQFICVSNKEHRCGLQVTSEVGWKPQHNQKKEKLESMKMKNVHGIHNAVINILPQLIGCEPVSKTYLSNCQCSLNDRNDILLHIITVYNYDITCTKGFKTSPMTHNTGSNSISLFSANIKGERNTVLTIFEFCYTNIILGFVECFDPYVHTSFYSL